MGGGILDPVDGPLGKIDDALNPLSVGRILKVLGIETHDETFSDIQISNLLTVGVADATARRTATRAAHNDINTYNQSYQQFRRDYRKKYSNRFLTSLGYDPTTNATTRILDRVDVLSYVQGTDPTASAIDKFYGRYISKEEAMYYYMQNTYGAGWDNATRVLLDSGKTYTSPAVVNDGTNLNITLTREYVDTIVDNLTTNYQYSETNNTVVLNTGPDTAVLSGTSGIDTKHVRVEVGTAQTIEFDILADTPWSETTISLTNGTYTVEVYETDSLNVESLVDSYSVVINNEELYDVGLISSNTTGDPLEYTTIVTLQSDGVTEVSISTLVEYFTDSTSNALLLKEQLYVYYLSTDTNYYVYIEDMDTVPSGLYTDTTVEITAIIPLKEDNVVKDLEDYKLKRMLSKLNLAPDDLVESLQNTDMDSAYIMTGIHPGETSPAACKALYQTFDTAAEGSGAVTISMDKLSMKYTFDMEKEVISGNVQAVGTYSKTLVDDVMVMIYQGSATEYKKITITEYTQVYTISGQGMSTGLNGDAAYSRVIIPLQILNGLRYREFTDVYERSLCMLAFSTEVVTVKWYETGAFGVVLKIVAVIITIFSWGAASSWAALLWSMATTAAYAVVIAYVIRWGISQGTGFGYAIALIATVIGAMYNPGTGWGTGAGGWLMTASSILDTMNQALQFKTNELIMKGEEELREIAEQHGDILEKLDEMKDEYEIVTSMNFNMMQACEPASELVDPDSYIALMQGSVAMDFDQLYAIDYEIDRRKQVLV